MKSCIYCGKALDEQANFCPYCMHTQQAATPAPQIPIKTSYKWVWFIIAAAVLLVGGILATLLLLPTENTPTKDTSDTLQTDQSAYDLHAQFGTLLGKEYESVRDFFGTELAPVTIDPFTELETHYFNGIEIDVMPSTDVIYAFTVDYTQADPPHRYNYRGIDSNASYNDVIKILGLPSDDSGYPYDITYAMEQGYLRVSFDQNTNVTKLFFLFPVE